MMEGTNASFDFLFPGLMPGSINEGSLNLCSVYAVGTLAFEPAQSSTSQHAGTVRNSFSFEARNCLIAFLFTEEASQCFPLGSSLPTPCNYWSAYIRSILLT